MNGGETKLLLRTNPGVTISLMHTSHTLTYYKISKRLLFYPPLPLLCKKPGGVFVVEVEEELNALCFAYEWLWAVGKVYDFVELVVGLNQRWGHGERVVEVGEAAAGECGSRIEHLLRRLLNGLPLLCRGAFGPGKVVVDNGA